MPWRITSIWPCIFLFFFLQKKVYCESSQSWESLLKSIQSKFWFHYLTVTVSLPIITVFGRPLSLLTVHDHPSTLLTITRSLLLSSQKERLRIVDNGKGRSKTNRQRCRMIRERSVIEGHVIIVTGR